MGGTATFTGGYACPVTDGRSVIATEWAGTRSKEQQECLG
jgi:hypothetical protein